MWKSKIHDQCFQADSHSNLTMFAPLGGLGTSFWMIWVPGKALWDDFGDHVCKGALRGAHEGPRVDFL